MFSPRTNLTARRVLQSLRYAVHRAAARGTVLEACDRFRTHFTNSAAGAWRSTRTAAFIDVNPAAAAILGYDSIEELRAVNTVALHVGRERHDAFRLELDRTGRIITNQGASTQAAQSIRDLVPR